VTRRKLPPDVCRSCGRSGNQHFVSCKANRCVRCRRAPRLIGPLCGFCHSKRQKAVAAVLERLDGRSDHENR
jgi:hypothetical protein